MKFKSYLGRRPVLPFLEPGPLLATPSLGSFLADPPVEAILTLAVEALILQMTLTPIEARVGMTLVPGTKYSIHKNTSGIVFK